jgi:hypothetical protein
MSYQLPSADVFTKISDASEKARLFSDLTTGKSDLLAKLPDPNAEVFSLMAQDYKNHSVFCKFLSSHGQFPTDGEIILYFFIGGEKYFFQTHFHLQGDQLVFKTDSPLFHLQRREDYRIKIPANYRALIEIVSIAGKTAKFSIPLLDLSGGGCRIQFNPKQIQMKMQDELKGHLFLPDRDPIGIVASVRYIKADTYGKLPSMCGLQFVGLTEPLKNRIIAVVMDLYREFFAGRS